jgi:RNA polymerase sigma-70 factor (ECF subfamily)
MYAEALKLASEGLPEAPPTFRVIYDGHFDFVWRFAANRGVPQSSLDDVVQEVFVVVHRQLVGFEGRSALRTWIAGITRNVVRSYLRKRGNQSPGEPLESDELYPSDELGPAEVLEKKSASELLDMILDKMSELQREAFILCEIEGLSAVETAEALRVNENTLRTRLHDARKVFNAVSARLRAQRFWVTREGGNES